LNKRLTGTITFFLLTTFSILAFQNCDKGVNSKNIEGPGGASPTPPTEPIGLPTPPQPPVPTTQVELLHSFDFNAQVDIDANFTEFSAPQEWTSITTQRAGNLPDRDPIFEEGHYSRPGRSIQVVDNEILNIYSTPTIVANSTPEECNSAIMGLRNWGSAGSLVKKVDPDGDGRFFFPNGVNGGTISAGSPLQAQEYWDALGDCRIYTGSLSTNETFGPGTRFQIRFSLEQALRTGNIFFLRLITPEANTDTNPATGFDMSAMEFGQGSLRSDVALFGTQRNWFNSALRGNESLFSYFVDTTVDPAGVNYQNFPDFLTWQATWNPDFQNWLNDTDGFKALTLIPSAWPEDFNIYSGWYVLTVDWRSGSLNYYLQKEDTSSEYISYFSTTNTNFVSQSCDQKLVIGNNVSQTFSETAWSIWAHVNNETDQLGLVNILSDEFPGGREYREYTSDALQVDWVKIYKLLDDTNAPVCP